MRTPAFWFKGNGTSPGQCPKKEHDLQNQRPIQSIQSEPKS
jgi:hypothetical protein